MVQPSYAEIEAVFELVDREIWIVTAQTPLARSGLVATWVNQSSIDPKAPLVSIGLAPNHFTTQLVTASRMFCLHLIASNQIELAWRFGLGSGRDGDKFAGLATTVAETGSPVLPMALAWLDCRVVESYDAGDRIYFWADVVSGHRNQGGKPLRQSELLTAANHEQAASLRASMLADRALHAPLRATWRAQLAARGKSL